MDVRDFGHLVDDIFVYFYQTTAGGDGIKKLIDSIIENYEHS